MFREYLFPINKISVMPCTTPNWFEFTMVIGGHAKAISQHLMNIVLI